MAETGEQTGKFSGNLPGLLCKNADSLSNCADLKGLSSATGKSLDLKLKDLVEMSFKRVAFMVDLATSFGRKVLEGVHSHPARQQWSLLAESWGDVGWQDLLGEGTLDGILVDSDEPQLMHTLQSFDGPIVDLSGSLRHAHCSSVAADYAQIGRIGAEHLRDRGFHRLGFLGIRRWSPSREIEVGFVQAAEQFASELSRYQSPRRWTGRQSRERESLAEWLSGLPRPCGVLAGDDVAGRRLLQACRKLDLAVPEQVAVLGVGDYEMVTTISDPALSSVIVPAREIGFQAAGSLERLFQEATDLSQRKVSSPAVAARRSTDSLAWEDPLLRSALQWLNEHATESLRVPDLAEHLCVSRRLLEQRFRDTLGHGPAEQLRRVRLRRAESLLRETDLGLGPIAKMSGLGTAERLCVLFRQYLHMTPGTFRSLLPQSRIASHSQS